MSQIWPNVQDSNDSRGPAPIQAFRVVHKVTAAEALANTVILPALFPFAYPDNNYTLQLTVEYSAQIALVENVAENRTGSGFTAYLYNNAGQIFAGNVLTLHVLVVHD